MNQKIVSSFVFVTLLSLIVNIIGSDDYGVTPEKTSKGSVTASDRDEVLQDFEIDYDLFPELKKTYAKPKVLKKFVSFQEISNLALQFARVLYNIMSQDEFVNYVLDVDNEDKLHYYLNFARDVERENNMSEAEMNRYLELLLYRNEYKHKFVHILEYDLSNLYKLLSPSDQVISMLVGDLLEGADVNNLTWNDIANVYNIQWRIPVDYYQLNPAQKNNLLSKVNNYLKKSKFKTKLRKKINQAAHIA